MATIEDRLATLRAVYRTASQGTFVYSNTPQPTSTLAWLVSDTGGLGMRSLYARRNGFRIEPVSLSLIESPLGYGWSNQDAFPSLVRLTDDIEVGTYQRRQENLPFAVKVPTDDLTVTVTGATTTHTIVFGRRGGGYISSWTFDNGVINEQIVNTGGSLQRGIQVGMEWTDAKTLEFVRHGPVQGGDIYSMGGLTKSISVTQPTQGGTKVRVELIPIESDPDGSLAIPGVRSYHGGDGGRPVYWSSMPMAVETWVNYRGVENLHRVVATVEIPEAVRSAFFDMSLYLLGCFRDDLFPNLRAYDTTAGATTISTGATGVDGYQAEWRRYTSNRLKTQGDDEPASTAAVVPNGRGGVAATGALDSDLAVLVGGALNADAVLDPTKSIDEFPKGNAYTWLQNRAGVGGADGDNLIALAHGAFLTGRLHPYNSIRTMPKGQISLTSYLITDTWTNVQTLADANLI